MAALDLDGLRGALRLMCPDQDWSWLLALSRRIKARCTRKSKKYHAVTSDRLYVLGLELMDRAATNAEVAKGISKVHAIDYRDGLMIAFLALIPLRRRTLTALRIREQLVKTGNVWALVIPSADSKTRRSLDYPLCEELCARIDVYVGSFRGRLPWAHTHDGLWPSNKRRPMCAIGIYKAVRRRTEKAFGHPVNPHRFRHAAANFWSIRDPQNVRGAKDLLGQASFGVTEKYYIAAQSRLAGHALADAVSKIRR
ncbi:MAG: tyrosine-type recombinase/integrase [Candidatus Sulfotelmatobacter sp.]